MHTNVPSNVLPPAVSVPFSSRIKMDGGELDIEWKESDNHVYMTGPATIVFDGEIEI